MRTPPLMLMLVLVALSGCSEYAMRPANSDSVESSDRGAGRQIGSVALDRDGQLFELWQNQDNSIGTAFVFVRTDCPISNRSAPTLKTICEKYQPLGIDFYLVYVSPREDAESIRQHREAYGFTCAGLLDRRHALVDACGATVTPEAVVCDRARKVVYQGRIDDQFADLASSRATATTHELADALDAVVNHRPVAQSRTKAVGCYIGDLR